MTRMTEVKPQMIVTAVEPSWKQRAINLAPWAVPAIAIAFFWWSLISWGLSGGVGYQAAVKLCDQAVPTLLHNKDQVEVLRAGILIHELNCSISRRLEREEEQ